ncbi:MAG TPA: four-carbon acid sugar kinase family protein [Mycobacterium sp.]
MPSNATQTAENQAPPTAADILAAAPPLRYEPGARATIRAANAASGRRIAVLDDDPTGSQTVHDVAVVTVFEDAEYAAGLAAPGSTCFVLTNTRSLPEDAASSLTSSVADSLFSLGQRMNVPVEVVGRGDSTLRGHVLSEIRAIDRARRRVIGTGFDGVLLVPAYFEAGRFTAGDIHWANVDGELIPVGESEFARDASFGYTSSNLREFIAEKSVADSATEGAQHGAAEDRYGTITPDEVHSISLSDIREGGPERVAEILSGVTGGAFVVVNATDYADLDVVVLGLLQAQARGKSFVYRCGPSFPQVLAGLDPQEPLTAQQIWPAGNPGGHGLVVVGSHVGLTNRQIAKAQERGGLAEAELDVPTLIDRHQRDAHVADISRQVIKALDTSDVLLFTSRTLLRGGDADDSLAISRNVSTAVIEVVQAALAAHPSWVVAKGGITSHDVAVRGLGIRRAEVVGQLLPGMVSVFRPIQASPEAVGTPYVVFAGNVGNDDTLADVIDLFTGKG